MGKMKTAAVAKTKTKKKRKGSQGRSRKGSFERLKAAKGKSVEAEEPTAPRTTRKAKSLKKVAKGKLLKKSGAKSMLSEKEI